MKNSNMNIKFHWFTSVASAIAGVWFVSFDMMIAMGIAMTIAVLAWLAGMLSL